MQRKPFNFGVDPRRGGKDPDAYVLLCGFASEKIISCDPSAHLASLSWSTFVWQFKRNVIVTVPFL